MITIYRSRRNASHMRTYDHYVHFSDNDSKEVFKWLKKQGIWVYLGADPFRPDDLIRADAIFPGMSIGITNLQ